jgi:hypothetical protein
MIAIKIGTTSWRVTNALAGDEVQFIGNFVYAPDGITPYMVWDGGLNNVRAMTAPEIAALPGQIATARAQQEKAAATIGIDNGQLQNGDKFERICRAVALVALDAFNTDRTAMTAMNTAVQAATTLADLKTRFALISFPPQVTAAQLVTAIKTKIAATGE